MRVLSPDLVDEIVRADAAARARAIRGHDRDEGLLQSLASWVLGLLGPPVLGYFGTTDETPHLNCDVLAARGAYVLTHALVHAAQWQRHPALSRSSTKPGSRPRTKTNRATTAPRAIATSRW